MKIRLISPTIYGTDERLVKTKKAFVPNLAITYLAGMVPKQHQVQLTDEAVQDIDFKEDVDLVGVTTTTITAERAYKIASIFRARGVKVVLGGIHPSFLPDEALQYADAIVIGEAEDSWPQLLNDFENGSLKTRYECEKRASIENLRHPRYDLLDRSKYMRLAFRKSIMIPIQTSRGCPHRCSFCSVSRFWGSNMRYRPVKDVIEEIKMSNSDTFFFTDDNLLFNPKRAEELLKALIPLKIKYFCQMDSRVHSHPELIGLLRRSGCFLAFIGLESLNNATLNNMHKAFNKPEEYQNLFRLMNKNGINVYASFMFGSEGDTVELAKETADFLTKERVSLASFFFLAPLPGTELYQDLLVARRLTDDQWWLRQSIFQPLGLEFIRVAEGKPGGWMLRGIAMREFYSWPSILKRFSSFRLNKLTCLAINIANKRKIDKHGVMYM